MAGIMGNLAGGSSSSSSSSEGDSTGPSKLQSIGDLAIHVDADNLATLSSDLKGQVRPTGLGDPIRRVAASGSQATLFYLPDDEDDNRSHCYWPEIINGRAGIFCTGWESFLQAISDAADKVGHLYAEGDGVTVAWACLPAGNRVAETRETATVIGEGGYTSPGWSAISHLQGGNFIAKSSSSVGTTLSYARSGAALVPHIHLAEVEFGVEARLFDSSGLVDSTPETIEAFDDTTISRVDNRDGSQGPVVLGAQAKENPAHMYRGFHGWIFEVVIYLGTLADDDRQWLLGYLQERWGGTPAWTPFSEAEDLRVCLDARIPQAFETTYDPVADSYNYDTLHQDGEEVNDFRGIGPHRHIWDDNTYHPRPIYRQGYINGRPALEFEDRTADNEVMALVQAYISSPSHSLQDLWSYSGDGLTIFMALQFNGTSPQATLPFVVSMGAAMWGQHLSLMAGPEAIRIYTPTDFGGEDTGQTGLSLGQTEAGIYSARITFDQGAGGEQLVRWNGVEYGRDPITLAKMEYGAEIWGDEGPTIGKISKPYFELERFFVGGFGGLYVVQRPLSDAEILQWEAGLFDAWGIV